MSEPGAPSPELFLRVANAYRDSAALKGAVDLDLFTAIAEGATTVPALAARCHATERGIRILCDYLVVLGFVTKAGNAYALTRDSAVFLDRRSPAYMGDAVHFLLGPLFTTNISDVAAAVRKGGVATSARGSDEPGHPQWVEFARSMTGMMRKPAELLAQAIDLPAGRESRVLDIAAGSGVYGIAVAGRHPQARVTAVDWPNVLQVARENAEAAGVAARMDYLPGSAFEVAFVAPYDAVLVCNFLHHFDPPSCETFLARARDVLGPDGRIHVVEFVPDEDRVSPPVAATFALQMLRQTPGGDAYTAAEYTTMFEHIGMRVESVAPLVPGASSLIVARR